MRLDPWPLCKCGYEDESFNALALLKGEDEKHEPDTLRSRHN
jgi:hypothetical protein